MRNKLDLIEVELSRVPSHNLLLDGVVPLTKMYYPATFLNTIPSGNPNKKFLDEDDFERIINSVIIPRLKTATSRARPESKVGDVEVHKIEGKYSKKNVSIWFILEVKNGIGEISNLKYETIVVGELK